MSTSTFSLKKFDPLFKYLKGHYKNLTVKCTAIPAKILSSTILFPTLLTQTLLGSFHLTTVYSELMWFFFLPHPHPSALFSLTALSFFQQENLSFSEELGKTKTLDWPNMIPFGNWGKAKSINTSLLILFEHYYTVRGRNREPWAHRARFLGPLLFEKQSAGLPWWLRWWRICLQCGRPRFDPWVRKIPWRREWQQTSVLPGESHGQRSLASQYYLENLRTEEPGISDSETAEWLMFHFISEG